jgi:hypothetical protein
VPGGRSVSVFYPKSLMVNVPIVLAKLNGGCVYVNVSSVLAEGFGVVILKNSATNGSMSFGRERGRGAGLAKLYGVTHPVRSDARNKRLDRQRPPPRKSTDRRPPSRQAPRPHKRSCPRARSGTAPPPPAARCFGAMTPASEII